jgi:hypothetical protein
VNVSWSVVSLSWTSRKLVGNRWITRIRLCVYSKYWQNGLT